MVAIGSKAAVAQPGDVFDVTVLGASAIAGSSDHGFNNGTQLPGAWTDTNSLRGATAIGGSAKALSSRATALGYQSEARGIGTIAIGSGAIAGVSATNNTGTGDVANAIAIGNASNASAASSVAIGREAQAIGESTVAIGSIAGKNALGAKSVLIGYESGLDSASGNSVYIGDGAGRGQKADPRGNIGSSSLPGHNVGIGHWTLYNSTGEGNTALGLRAGREQKGSDNTHIGAFAGYLQDGDYNVNAGYFAGQKSKGEKNLNLGIEAGASHTGSSSVSLGDSANKGTTSERSVAIGRSSASTGNDSIALGSQAIAGNAVWDSVGGKYSASTALNDIAIGTASKAAGGNSIALGTSATVSGAKSIAIGYGNEVKGAGSGAIGVPSRIDGNASYAMGNDNVVGTGSNNVFILGNNVNIGATDVKRDVDTGIVTSYTPTANPVSGAVALGNNTGVTVAGGVALGEGSQATIGANVAGYDPKTGSASADTSPTWKATNAAVSVGKADGTLTRQITGVAAGTVATDAVNVAQLKAVAENPLVFAGDSGANVSRKLGETLNIKGGASDVSVEDNIGVVADSGANTLTVRLAKELKGLTSVTTEDAFGNTTTQNVDGITITDGIKTVSLTTAGLNNGGNVISHVAAGKSATDAANISQLSPLVTAINATFNATTGAITAPSYTVGAVSGISTVQGAINQLNSNLATAKMHYYSVNSIQTGTGSNYSNDGATGTNALAAGVNAVASNTNDVFIGTGAGVGFTPKGVNNAYLVEDYKVVNGKILKTDGTVPTAEEIANFYILGNSVRYLQDNTQLTPLQTATSTNVGIGANVGKNSTGFRNVALGNEASQNFYGQDSISIGTEANKFDQMTHGFGSVAIGKQTKTSADSAVALGQGAYVGIGTNKINQLTSTAAASIAIGFDSAAYSDSSVAMGSRAQNYGATSIAIGAGSLVAAGRSNIAIGTGATTSFDITGTYTDSSGNIAVGAGAKTSGNISTAVGTGAVARTLGSAFGSYAYALDDGSTALGNSSSAKGLAATAIGSYSRTLGWTGVALGESAVSTARASAALGSGTFVSGVNSGVFGTTAATKTFHERDYAAGVAGSTNLSMVLASNAYAIGNANLIGSTSSGSFALGNNVKIGADSATVTRTRTPVNGINQDSYATTETGKQNITDAVGIGNQAEVWSTSGIAMGKGAIAGDKSNVRANAIAIGASTKATQKDALAVGAGNTAAGQNSTVIGSASSLDALSQSSSTLGSSNTGTAAINALLLGNNNTISGSSAVSAIGGLNKATGSVAASLTGIGNTMAKSSGSSVSGVGNTITQTSGLTLVEQAAFATLMENISSKPAYVISDQDQALIDKLSSNNVSGTLNKLVDSRQNNVLGDQNTLTNGTQNLVAGFKNTLGANLQGNQILSSGGTVLANVQDGVLIGRGSTLGASNAVVIGQGSTITTAATGAVALGQGSSATVAGGVALGQGSQATVAANVAGYDPATGLDSLTNSAIWKATNAAVSVGKADGALTRQITGVAAGKAATDAVNVAQLKAAASASKTKVTEGSNIVVSSTTGADGSETYTVKTAQDLAVNTVTTGNTTISSDGLTINGGPSVTTTGINAGGNKITNVAAGTNSTDAVNFAQLQAVVAGSASKSVVAAGTNVASVTKTVGGTGEDIYTVNADATSVEAGSTYVTVTPGSKDASNVTKYNVDLSAQTKTDIVAGAEAADVVAKKGLTFTGDNSSTSDAIKLGETLAITGDSNITTEAAGTGLQVKLNTELTGLTSVTTTDTAGNKTVTNGSGITITPAVGNAVSLTTAGLDNGGNTITNVGSAGTLNATNSNAATGADVYNAIHGTDGLLDTATFGLKAQDNSTVTKKLNNTVSVVGGHTGAGTTSAKNIKTVINATGELEIQMAETPEFASVTVGATGAQTQLSSTGANQLQIGSTGAKPITVDAATGVITGLSNTTWNGTATAGRAATEDQLQAVHDAAKATADAAVQYDTAGGVVNKDSVTLAGTTGTAVTPNADGTFTSMSGGTALNNVASAGDISDVNNAYKAVNAGDLNNQVAGLTSKGLKFTANNGTVHTAALGSTISVKGAAANTDADKFDAGKNIMTSVDASGNILVAMAKDLKADSVSTGATTINNDGLTITGGPSVTTTGINAGSKAITNVADGTVAADSKDAVTGGQLYGTADSVKTILGGNAALGADGKLTMSNIGGTGKGTIDEAVKAAYDKAGEAADAAKKHTTVVAGQNVTVTEGTNADGGKEYTVAVKDDIELTSVTTGATKMDTTGVTIKNADPAKTVSLTADGLNNGGNKITNVADGAVAANSKDAVTGGQLYSTNTQVAGNTAALGGGAKFDSASNTFTAPVYNVTDANGNAKVVNDVGSAIEALNQGFKVTSAATGSGTVSGTATTAVKSGSTTTYVAGDNIALTQDGMKFTIATNKNVNFDKVTVGDVVLDKDNGIDAGNKQITNVGDGVNPGDAVNKKQLEAAINGNKEGLNALQQQIGQVSADANAGAASAMATAGLPQAYTPGKSMIAAAGSVYKGATAQAIGISTITENGKWVFKGSVNVNNRGYAGATVGVGYQW